MTDPSDLDLDDLERTLRDVIASVESAIGGGLEQGSETDEAVTIGQLDLGIERLGSVLSELQDTLEAARGVDWIDLGTCARRALERAVVDVPVPLRIQSEFPPQELRARVPRPGEAPSGLVRLISVVLRACELGDVLRLGIDENDREVSLLLALEGNKAREGVRRMDSPSRAATLQDLTESIGGTLDLGPDQLVVRFPRVDAKATQD